MSTNIKYLITAIGAFLLGLLWYSNQKKKSIDGDFNKTVAKISNGKYFLIFNSVVVLSREITKEQYESFLKQYPTGIADSNVMNEFSSHPSKYTIEGGKYYEYTWDGNKYGQGIEITKAEYSYLSKNNNEMALMSENYI